MDENEYAYDLADKLYRNLMKKFVGVAKWQSKHRDPKNKFYEYKLIMYANNCSEGIELLNMNKSLFDITIKNAISYLNKISVYGEEYLEYERNRSANKNAYYNNLKKQKRIHEGTYVTKEEHIKNVNKKRIVDSYNKLVDAYEVCEKAKIKPQIVKLMEISGLSRATVIKYKKKYLASLNSASNIVLDTKRVLKKKKD